MKLCPHWRNAPHGCGLANHQWGCVACKERKAVMYKACRITEQDPQWLEFATEDEAINATRALSEKEDHEAWIIYLNRAGVEDFFGIMFGGYFFSA
jgi:hypothetical protein